MNHALRLYVEYADCIGCETCELVCAFLRKRPGIVMARTPGGEMVPVYCHHCSKPQCVTACEHNALERDASGAVRLDETFCAGCETRTCMDVCPFGALFCAGTRGEKVHKCDLCSDRRAVGLAPACVEMCPTGALRLVPHPEARPQRTEKSLRALQNRVRCLFRLDPGKP